MIADELNKIIREGIIGYLGQKNAQSLDLMVEQLSQELTLIILINFELKKRGG